jgi:alpha/beta superfamily hydrolase
VRELAALYEWTDCPGKLTKSLLFAPRLMLERGPQSYRAPFAHRCNDADHPFHAPLCLPSADEVSTIRLIAKVCQTSKGSIKEALMPEVIFTGPAGRLEGRYHPAKQKNAPIAMVLHPHPQFRGSMNHPIVYQVYYAFAARGFSVLRFNFRGVGRSQGSFDHGTGELSDAASALDWAQTINPEARACWVAGFSFGAWIGMQLLMRRPEVEGFISIAPEPNRYDFSFLAPCPSSGLIVHGDKDIVAPAKDVNTLVEKLKTQKGIVIDQQTIPGANHFFEEKMEPLMETVTGYLDMRLANVR